MVEQIRTSEDHNGDGTGVPPFPRVCREYDRGFFNDLGYQLELDHELDPETSTIAVRFEPSDKCRLYGTDGDPTETDAYTRFLGNVTTGHSVLGSRTIRFKVTNIDQGDPITTFDIVIWEW
jgi:hypothetical protein